MAKPTWMSTQSPTTTWSSSSRPMLMVRRTPATSTLARWGLSPDSSTTWPGIPRHIGSLLSAGERRPSVRRAVLDRFQHQFLAARQLHVEASAGRAGVDELLGLGVLPARPAAGRHRQKHQVGVRAVDDAAGCGHREGLGECLGMDVVEPPDTDLHPSHRTVPCPLLDGGHDVLAQSQLVHQAPPSSLVATTATFTATSGETRSERI